MMNTLITVIPKLVPLVYDIIEKDGNHEYGLKYNADYGVIRTTHFKAFDYIDDLLVVEKVDDYHSHWWIKSFEAGKGYFDGTSLMPDKGKFWIFDFDALFKAALFHDCVYKKADDISKATGVPINKILAFADDMLKLLADCYGAKKSITNPVHWLVRTGGMLYHKVKGYFGTTIIVIGLLLSVFCNGCYTIRTEMLNDPPDIQITEPIFE